MKAVAITLAFVAVSSLALASSPVPRPEPQTLECKHLRAVCDTGSECCSGHCTLQFGGRWHCGE